jgi:hypothetical protein
VPARGVRTKGCSLLVLKHMLTLGSKISGRGAERSQSSACERGGVGDLRERK